MLTVMLAMLKVVFLLLLIFTLSLLLTHANAQDGCLRLWLAVNTSGLQKGASFQC